MIRVIIASIWNLGIVAFSIYAVWSGRSVWWLVLPFVFNASSRERK